MWDIKKYLNIMKQESVYEKENQSIELLWMAYFNIASSIHKRIKMCVSSVFQKELQKQIFIIFNYLKHCSVIEIEL